MISESKTEVETMLQMWKKAQLNEGQKASRKKNISGLIGKIHLQDCKTETPLHTNRLGKLISDVLCEKKSFEKIVNKRIDYKIHVFVWSWDLTVETILRKQNVIEKNS